MKEEFESLRITANVPKASKTAETNLLPET